jgi:response regulator RpfG family c-di-GMP phosphodiesterase
MSNQNEKFLFSEDRPPAAADGQPWKILVVDDDESVHHVTRLALARFRFDERPLQFISAYSSRQARKAVLEHPDTALILLDVVMESETAGLEVAQFIREEAGNSAVRIVLRTGQPGQAPEHEVIARYDINDYKEKTELTSGKLSTLLYASLRSYRDIVELEKSKRGLEAVIEASAKIFELRSMDQFSHCVLEQMSSLIQSGCNSPACQMEAFAVRRSEDGFHVTAGLGSFQQHVGAMLSEVRDPDIRAAISTALENGISTVTDESYTGLIRNRHGLKTLLYLQGLCGGQSELDRTLLNIFERNAAIAFENVDLLDEIEQTQSEMVLMLGETIETRSSETGHHVKRVAEISRLLALEYGLTEEETDIIQLASPLHDIGKIGIPDAILNKPGKLDAQEWDIMKTHTTLGYDILKSSSRKVMQAGAVIARDHHEKWAGGGYPANKRGEEIHLYGRITAVADVFDALGSERCYKKAWPLEDVLTLMRDERGRHFQPELVDILLDNIDRVTEICQRNRD